MWTLPVTNAMPKATIERSQMLTAALQQEVTRDEVNLVARDLWCPLCSGVRLDVCDLKACDQMREEIAIKLADGASSEEIKDYFLMQYGPQILGEPPRSGFNWLAWIVPVVALLGGGAYLLTSRRNASKQFGHVNGASANAPPNEAVDIASTNPDMNRDEPLSDKNNYEHLLDKELESYD